MNWENGFAYVLDPIPVEDFFEHYWATQRPLHIPGTPTKFQGLFDRAAFERALRDVPTNYSLHLRAIYRNAANDSTSEVGCIGVDEAFKHFAAGATLCATEIDIADANLTKLLDALRRDVRLPDRIVFNCYYSPEGQGFGTHYDSQAGWILQIEGTKVWQYSTTPAYPMPTVGGGPQHAGRIVPTDDEVVDRPADSTFVELTMRPGDVLYVPAGIWHRASAQGSSLALTLCLPHMGFYGVLVSALMARLLHRRDWRNHVPRLTNGLPQIAGQLSQRLNDLKALVDALTIVDVCDAWYDACFFDKRQELLWLESTDRIRVYHQGAKYSLPLDAAPLLRSVDSGDASAMESLLTRLKSQER